MKLRPQEARRFLERPDASVPGVLLHGNDPTRVAHRRQQLVAALLGPTGDDEMRLTRLSGGELTRDPARLVDEVKARGFFAGQRVVLAEEAGDGATRAVEVALEDWRPGDAFILVTAGQLTPRSRLRKLFEAHPSALAVAIYDDPPGRGEIEAELARAGLPPPPREAMDALVSLAQTLEPGDFRQTLEKLAIYKHGDATPLSLDDITACAPATGEAALDSLVEAVMAGAVDRLVPLLRRLESQGITPVTMLVATLRQLRRLHVVASHPGGPSEGAARLRPPVFGPRRAALVAQARRLGAGRLERAIMLVSDTDLSLRAAGQTAPQRALVERALIRLTMTLRR